MKRRVKVLMPLDDRKIVDAQMLDPRAPNFCSKVYNPGQGKHLNGQQSIVEAGQRASWDAGTGSSEYAPDSRTFHSKFCSMPEVLRSDIKQTDASNGVAQEPEPTSRSRSPENAFPAVPAVLMNSKWPKDTEASAPKGQGYESSTQSECSATSAIEFEQEDGHIGIAKNPRGAGQSSQGEATDVHDAARRSIEQSLEHNLRRTSNPVEIPQRKSTSRRFFGF